MPSKIRNSTMTFTLGGLFALVTFVTVLLALGRVVGHLAITLFFLAPFPLVGYMIVIRSTMQRLEVDFQSRWPVTDLGLTIGLLVAALVSLTLLGAGLANLAPASSEALKMIDGPWR